MPVHIVRQDITKMRVDAIVNAANGSLLGGGGVDGAIHRAAGPKLLAECRKLGGCETGEAKITKAYNLPSKYVIHTVGPVWHGGDFHEEELLTACYTHSMELAQDAHCRSVAFPLISSGAYGYPKDEALRIAEETIRDFLDKNDSDMKVYIVVFSRSAVRIADDLYNGIVQFIDDHYTAPIEREERRRFLNASVHSSDQGPMLSHSPSSDFDGFPICGMPKDFEPLNNMLKELQEETFSQKLMRLIRESGMQDSECYRRANIDRKHFSKIRNNPQYQPKKKTVIAFAIALRLSLPMTQELLGSAGYILSHSNTADMIVEYYITKGIYDVLKVNEALFRFRQPSLSA